VKILMLAVNDPAGTGIGLLNPAGAPGFGLGAASVPVTINGITFTNLDALIAYGKSQNDFNIVSTPQVMTLDNSEAALTVAENRPFQTSSNIGRNVDDFTINQFQYRDVGTILKNTPQINEGGVIKLKIFQGFSEIDQAATGQTSSLLPVTRKRSTETTVLINEGQTVVLSGLIGKTTSRTESKVPGLGDIPLIGELFYLDRALQPFAEVTRGSIDSLLQRPLAMMVLADVGTLSAPEQARVDAELLRELLALAGLFIGEHALGRRDDRDALVGEHTR